MMERDVAFARIRQSARAVLAASAAVLLLSASASAQEAATTASPTLASVRVQPDAGRPEGPEPARSAPEADADPLKPDQQVVPAAEPERAVQEIPVEPASTVLSNMRIRGYADVSFGKPPQEKLPPGGLQASHQSFQIADLQLFVTSKLSEEWSFLAEVLFTSDFSNDAEAELDRLVVQYVPSKYLRLGFGKFNSAMGYYTNQFHRAKFYQIATGRPIMFTDEDNGGILPVHQIGITAQGEIPSGSLGLHYVIEIGNGRGFSARSAEVQNFADRNNLKAVNGGLFVRPDAAPALDVGFTVYRDSIESDDLARFKETITAVHAAWGTPSFEFLNEAVILKHREDATGETATTKSFYTQISRRFGIVHPYGRYDYQDVPPTDPVFGLGDVVPPFGIRKAISAGLRFDLANFAVVKFQYDRALQYGVWANGGHAQLAFAF